MKIRSLEIARSTFEMEAAALENIAKTLGQGFLDSLEAIYQCKGRAVVSGVGKSAIIAQKIAATFNSTGTPALFMHAADAIHGDLGMLQPWDIAILLSKSGESQEIKALVPLIKAFGNKLIAIVGNKNSYLSINADHFIETPIDEEACPNNLAPTTSTTTQMVAGDALAVCLMHLKGFGKEDFARFHPGGNLGKRLYLKAGELAARHQVPKVGLDTPVREVIIEITKKRLGACAVLDEQGQVIGIITDGDLRRMLEKNIRLEGLTSKDIYTLNPKTVGPDLLAIDCLQIFSKYDISHLIVQDKTDYKGILHIHDLIKEGLTY